MGGGQAREEALIDDFKADPKACIIPSPISPIVNRGKLLDIYFIFSYLPKWTLPYSTGKDGMSYIENIHSEIINHDRIMKTYH